MEALNQSSGNWLPAIRDLEGRMKPFGSAKTSMVERTIFKEASIPSPLAHESVGGSIEHDGHPKALEKTYSHIFRQKYQLLAQIQSQENFTDGRPGYGLLCWLEYAHAPRGNLSQGLGNVRRIPRNIKYAWLRQVAELSWDGSSQSQEATSEMESASAAPSVFAVIRQDFPQAGGDYIIETRDQISLSINGVPVGIHSRVRRFPDFAVIEADGNFIFWWRTQSAINFIPKNVGQKRPFEGSQRYENLYEELPLAKRSKTGPCQSSKERPFEGSQRYEKLYEGLPPVKRPKTCPSKSKERPFEVSQGYEKFYEELLPVKRFKTSFKESSRVFSQALTRNQGLDSTSTKTKWWEKLDKGLERHRRALREERRPPQNGTVKKPSPLENLTRDPYDYPGLWDDQMMTCIGVIWDALRQNDILFAIADQLTLKLCRDRAGRDVNFDSSSTLGPNTFIIPLDLGPERAGQIGHYVLAVAQVTDRGPIKIKLMDSSPGIIAKQHIHAAVAGVVMYSGWLGKNGTNPLMVWPTIEFTNIVVPKQEISNACGLNVVLNAWAEMLNISINDQRYRVKACEDKDAETEESADFLRQTIEIINLAILGHMDTETILAFMISYGYAKVGIPLNPEDRDGANYVPQLEIPPLTTSIKDLIHRVNDAMTPSRSDDNYDLNVPNQDDLRFLMNEAQCDERVASKALKDSNGDMRIARWFIPVPWKYDQKVKSLIEDSKCSRKEAKEALSQANGNSRMAHWWVKAARKRLEEEQQRIDSERIKQQEKEPIKRAIFLSSSEEEDGEGEGDEEDEEDGDVEKALAESIRLEEEAQVNKAVELSLYDSLVPGSPLMPMPSRPTPKSDFSGNESIVPTSSDEDSE